MTSPHLYNVTGGDKSQKRISRVDSDLDIGRFNLITATTDVSHDIPITNRFGQSDWKYRTAMKMLIPFRFGGKVDGTIPVHRAGFFSFIYLTWITNKLIEFFQKNKKGETGSIWTCSQEDSCDVNVPRLKRLWEEEQKKNGERALLYNAIMRFTRTRFFGSLFAIITNVTVTFLVMSFLIEAITSFLENLSSPFYYGMILLVVFAFGQLMRLSSFSLVWCLGFITGTRVRNACLGLIYDKILQLQFISGKQNGELINMFVTDSLRLYLMSIVTPYLFSLPFYMLLGIGYSIYLLKEWGLLTALIFYCAYKLQDLLSKRIAYLRHKTVFLTDERVRKMAEIISNIKLIKMYAWENTFMDALMTLRKKEKKLLQVSTTLQSISSGISIMIPTLASVITIASYRATGHEINAATAFAFLGALNMLRAILNILPWANRCMAEAKISMIRMQNILSLENYEPEFTVPSNPRNAVEIRNGNFEWEEMKDFTQKPKKTGTSTFFRKSRKKKRNQELNEQQMGSNLTLHDISFTIEKGKLIGVCGPVGCGKSSLLSVFLGRIKKTSGTVALKGEVTVASQQAWIFNGTVKENILFGSKMDTKKYQEVIRVCGLITDFEILPNGDETEIGDRGTNLSGGQKQRVSVARAVYSNQSIYLLDDPLSAVDVRVGKHIFYECFKKFMQGKTIILTTHQLQYLKDCDKIIVMDHGRIVETGSHEEIMQKDGYYARLIETYYAGLMKKEEDKDQESDLKSKTQDAKRKSKVESDAIESNLSSSSSSSSSASDILTTVEDSKPAGTITRKESMAFGSISPKIYCCYIKAGGGFFAIILVLLTYLIAFATIVFANYWLSYWINEMPVFTEQNQFSISKMSVEDNYLNNASRFVNIKQGTFSNSRYSPALLSLQTSMAFRTVPQDPVKTQKTLSSMKTTNKDQKKDLGQTFNSNVDEYYDNIALAPKLRPQQISVTPSSSKQNEYYDNIALAPKLRPQQISVTPSLSKQNEYYDNIALAPNLRPQQISVTPSSSKQNEYYDNIALAPKLRPQQISVTPSLSKQNEYYDNIALAPKLRPQQISVTPSSSKQNEYYDNIALAPKLRPQQISVTPSSSKQNEYYDNIALAPKLRPQQISVTPSLSKQNEYYDNIALAPNLRPQQISVTPSSSKQNEYYDNIALAPKLRPQQISVTPSLSKQNEYYDNIALAPKLRPQQISVTPSSSKQNEYYDNIALAPKLRPQQISVTPSSSKQNEYYDNIALAPKLRPQKISVTPSSSKQNEYYDNIALAPKLRPQQISVTPSLSKQNEYYDNIALAPNLRPQQISVTPSSSKQNEYYDNIALAPKLRPQQISVTPSLSKQNEYYDNIALAPKLRPQQISVTPSSSKQNEYYDNIALAPKLRPQQISVTPSSSKQNEYYDNIALAPKLRPQKISVTPSLSKQNEYYDNIALAPNLRPQQISVTPSSSKQNEYYDNIALAPKLRPQQISVTPSLSKQNEYYDNIALAPKLRPQQISVTPSSSKQNEYYDNIALAPKLRPQQISVTPSSSKQNEYYDNIALAPKLRPQKISVTPSSSKQNEYYDNIALAPKLRPQQISVTPSLSKQNEYYDNIALAPNLRPQQISVTPSSSKQNEYYDNIALAPKLRPQQISVTPSLSKQNEYYDNIALAPKLRPQQISVTPSSSKQNEYYDNIALAPKLRPQQISVTPSSSKQNEYYDNIALAPKLRPQKISVTPKQNSSIESSDLLINSTITKNSTDSYKGDQYYLIIYSSVAVFIPIMFVLKGISMAKVTMSASTKIHDQVLKSVIKSPMSFFESNPPGRILNRFSRDLDEADVNLPQLLDLLFQITFQSILYMLISAVIEPWLALAFIPAISGMVILRFFSIAAVRQLKRIENQKRSPLLSHVGTTTSGLVTITAFNQQDYFRQRFRFLIEVNSAVNYMFDAGLRWVGVRMDMMFSTVAIIAAFLFIYFRSSIPASFAALSLTFITSILNLTQFFVRFVNDCESRFTSIERLGEYAKLPPESDDNIKATPKNWPESGCIEFLNVFMKYRDDMNFVLKQVSFEILDKEKIGIVGRTGAGKSSLGCVLFRLNEIHSGTILIDKIDIATIQLEKLRSKISIIPQDPVLFNGTMRYNLDPFSEYTDEEIWQALSKVHMKEKIVKKKVGLEFLVEENGDNLSVGERQLICMGRAILRNNRILMLDEATASIDTETDAMIQSTIQNAFADCTVLTIAHRLNTVLHCDKILVMDKGQAIEFASPEDLLEDPTSNFYQMFHSGDN